VFVPPRPSSSSPIREIRRIDWRVAIAHRLQTAHDADRVAVVEDGRLSELGTHDGSYAALWESWHGGRRSPADN
jgi:ABC-type multidrug transport system fused ATPase/permease subunit